MPATATHNFMERSLIPAYDFDAKEMVIIVVGYDQQEIHTHLKGSGDSDSSEIEQSPTEHTGANQQGESEDHTSSVQQESPDHESGDAQIQQISEASKKTKFSAEGKENESTTFLFIGNLSQHIDEEWLTREFEMFGQLERVRVITKKGNRP